MALSKCPDFEILVTWLEHPAEGRSSEISDHIAVCERCTALVAAGAAELQMGRVSEPIADKVPDREIVGAVPSRHRLRTVAIWAAVVTLAVATGSAAYWRTRTVEKGSEVESPKRDPSLGPPISEWSRQEIIEFITSSRSHETNELAKIFDRCRNERIDEAVPRALRLYRKPKAPAPGPVPKHVIAARAFIDSYMPEEIEAALKRHENQWMTYDRYIREFKENGGNR